MHKMVDLRPRPADYLDVSLMHFVQLHASYHYCRIYSKLPSLVYAFLAWDASNTQQLSSHQHQDTPHTADQQQTSVPTNSLPDLAF